MDFKTGTKRLITLAWNDVEPKVQAAFATGAVVTLIEGALAVYGITLPGYIDGILVLLATAAAGYIKKTSVRIPVAAPAAKVELLTAAEVAAENLP